MMTGIDRAPHVATAATALAADAICSPILFVACVTQIFDFQQRAVRLHAFTDELLSVLPWLWRLVPRGHVVATIGSLLQAICMTVRECASTCACTPFWRPQRLCASAIGPR